MVDINKIRDHELLFKKLDRLIINLASAHCEVISFYKFSKLSVICNPHSIMYFDGKDFRDLQKNDKVYYWSETDILYGIVAEVINEGLLHYVKINYVDSESKFVKNDLINYYLGDNRAVTKININTGGYIPSNIVEYIMKKYITDEIVKNDHYDTFDVDDIRGPRSHIFDKFTCMDFEGSAITSMKFSDMTPICSSFNDCIEALKRNPAKNKHDITKSVNQDNVIYAFASPILFGAHEFPRAIYCVTKNYYRVDSVIGFRQSKYNDTTEYLCLTIYIGHNVKDKKKNKEISTKDDKGNTILPAVYGNHIMYKITHNKYGVVYKFDTDDELFNSAKEYTMSSFGLLDVKECEFDKKIIDISNIKYDENKVLTIFDDVSYDEYDIKKMKDPKDIPAGLYI